MTKVPDAGWKYSIKEHRFFRVPILQSKCLLFRLVGRIGKYARVKASPDAITALDCHSVLVCFQKLVLGGEHTLTIHCDHKNLTYYHTPQWLTARQAQWWTNLSRYNYQLIYIPRAKLIQADTLSWRPDHTKGEDGDELVTMLPEEQFILLIAMNLRDQIKTLSSNDEFIKGIIKCLKERSTPPFRLPYLIGPLMMALFFSKIESMYLTTGTSDN